MSWRTCASKDTTSHGLCDRVGPPHTIEGRREGEVEQGVGDSEEKRGARGGVDRRSDNATSHFAHEEAKR